MILLNLQFAIQTNQAESAIAASDFMGGVLHGTFERLVITHAPIIGDQLGIMPRGQLKHYAILPPPFGKPQNITDMQCGIILYGQAKKYVRIIVALLEKWDEIRLAGRTSKIQCNQILYRKPGLKTSVWRESEQDKTFDHPPDFTRMYSADDGITINFITPLKLGRFNQIAHNTYTSSPRLLQIVRSIARRIKKLEPGLANTLGIDTLAWIEAEEQIRYIQADRHELEHVNWKYGSSTKQTTIKFSGLLGQIHYTGHIPAAIITLLHWGLWFGIGQSTALGQGMYYIDVPLINFKSN